MGFGQGLGLRPRAGAKGLGFGLRPRLGLWARAWAKAKAGAKGAKAKAGTQKNTNLSNLSNVWSCVCACGLAKGRTSPKTSELPLPACAGRRRTKSRLHYFCCLHVKTKVAASCVHLLSVLFKSFSCFQIFQMCGLVCACGF